MLKKLMSVILSLLIVTSVLSSFSAFATESETEILGPGAEGENLPEVAEGCNRYFFYMPKSWECEYSQEASIFWWEGTGCMTNWPGVKANKGDAEGLYYYDVPKDVTTIMWANNMDSTLAYPLPEYKGAKATCNIGTEFYYPGESELYPDGVESFHNMVYVIDIEECSNDAGRPAVVEYYGEWYYYYGNGEYGVTKEKGDTVYTQRHFGERDYYFDLPEVAEGCNRYFFYMPEDWYNEYAYTAGVYWWEGTGAQVSWPGLKANKADAENVYYYDVPKDVENLRWNNYIKYAPDTVVGPEYYATCSTNTIDLESGKYSNMIYIITDLVNDDIQKLYDGQWQYYYGDGEYGTTASKDEATADEFVYPPIADGCNRYFFFLPESWENEFTQTAGIYWWEGAVQLDYPGVEANKADAEGLYYYDVPKEVCAIIWNNFLYNPEYDHTTPQYKAEQSTGTIGVEFYYPGESLLYPDGLASFNNMVYVVSFDECNCNDFVLPHKFDGDWYYYYGNGEYGITPEKGEVVYTERSLGDENSHNKPAEPTTPVVPDLEPYNRIYFVNTEGWDKVYSYVWMNDYDYHNAQWPGEEMELSHVDSAGNEIYTALISSKVHGLIFSDGIGKQTSDLTSGVYEGNMYCIYKETYEKYYVMIRDFISDYSMGDANLDMKFNIKDATTVQKFVAELIICDRLEQSLMDFDKDTKVNVKDATAIQKYLAGIETGYPIGEIIEE